MFTTLLPQMLQTISKRGDNVAWNGNTWDNLSGVVDLSPYAKTADVASTYMAIADYPTATDTDITGLFS